MLLGRVIGTVVTCVAYEGLEGVRLLIVQPLDRTGEPKGKLVTYEGGREAALALDPWFVPVDHAIVGIVDQVSRKGWKES